MIADTKNNILLVDDQPASAAQIGGSGHALTVDLPDEPLLLEADTTRLVQVLSNLLNNAAKYTPRRRCSTWC